jgi:hypothetical protein
VQERSEKRCKRTQEEEVEEQAAYEEEVEEETHEEEVEQEGGSSRSVSHLLRAPMIAFAMGTAFRSSE